MEALIEEIKQHLIDALNLEDMTTADIDADAPLFGDGLGLDSIDALEIILLVERNYGIKIDNTAATRPVFKSVRSLAEYVAKNRK